MRTRLQTGPAGSGTADDIERTVLLRELLGKLSEEERMVCLWKKAGFSSQEIADYQRRSVVAVDTLFSRAKQKLRRALGTGGNHRRMVTRADRQLRKPRRLGEEDSETDDDKTESGP